MKSLSLARSKGKKSVWIIKSCILTQLSFFFFLSCFWVSLTETWRFVSFQFFFRNPFLGTTSHFSYIRSLRDRVCRGWQLTSQHFYDLPVINGNILSFFPPISFFPAFKSEMSCRGRRVLVTPRNTRGWKTFLPSYDVYLTYLKQKQVSVILKYTCQIGKGKITW